MPEFLVILINSGVLVATFTLNAESESAAQIKAIAAYHEVDESEIDLDVVGDDQLYVCQTNEVIDLN